MNFIGKCVCGYESESYETLEEADLYLGFNCPCCGEEIDIIDSEDFEDYENYES